MIIADLIRENTVCASFLFLMSLMFDINVTHKCMICDYMLVLLLKELVGLIRYSFNLKVSLFIYLFVL